MNTKRKSIDQLAEEKVIELMKENPTKVLSWMVVQCGKIVVETNASNLNISVNATIEGQRYKITSITKVKKIKDKKLNSTPNDERSVATGS